MIKNNSEKKIGKDIEDSNESINQLNLMIFLELYQISLKYMLFSVHIEY